MKICQECALDEYVECPFCEDKKIIQRNEKNIEC